MSVISNDQYSNFQHLNKIADNSINGNEKIETGIVDKIKSGFLCLLKSVSNSFKSMIKIITSPFTSNDVNHNVNNTQWFNYDTISLAHESVEELPAVEYVYSGTDSITADKDKKLSLKGDNSLKSTDRMDFKQLKGKMHPILDILMKQRLSA